MAVGAAAASSSSAAATSSAYSAGVAAGSASTSAAYSTGYAAGTVAASAPPPVAGAVVVPASYVVGVNYAALPAGAMAVAKNGVNYYLSGNTWFKPAYGANGVYYTVVPTP
ncbi:MAG: hypothetical protein IPG16_15165 [Comamonadaceae bacterium]|jgi:hypothetical protein|nr:hypothetical protein [Comamonadaceae bacterium]